MPLLLLAMHLLLVMSASLVTRPFPHPGESDEEVYSVH